MKIRIRDTTGDEWIVDIDDFPKYMARMIFKELNRIDPEKLGNSELLLGNYAIFARDEK